MTTGQAGGGALTAIPVAVADPLVTAWLDTSDWGNAKRLVAIAAGKLKWIEDDQLWAAYDGRRFDVERGAIEAQRLAHRVIEHVDLEAEALGALVLAKDEAALRTRVGKWCSVEIAEERVKVLRSHAVRSGSAGMTGGMLKQARSFLAALGEDFDRDPLAYNCLNGTLRFVREEASAMPSGYKWVTDFRPHDPADMLMQLANVDYTPGDTCPNWRERLDLLTPDPEQRASFTLLYGYTLTGLTSDQAFYVHQGKGGDGKSATHMALADLHGDYYRHASVKTFLQGSDRGGAEHRSDLVRLKGDIRFVTCDEPKSRSVWDGETIKQVTGSLITARGSGERTEVTYRPRFKLHAECNIIPNAPSDDKGFRRRFKLFQWKVSLSDTPAGEEPIDTVLARLEAEKSGILNWLIDGCLMWLETRVIPQPQAMAAVLQDFWSSSSPLNEWMGEWCDTSNPEARTQVKSLYDNFKDWCEAQGIERIPTTTKFGKDLRDKQFAVIKDSRGIRWRKGIHLRAQGMFGGLGDGPAADASPDPVRGAPASSQRPAVVDDDEDFAP